jgi:hypothetical protein
MVLSRTWRLFLAIALLVATQSSLLHPFKHFHARGAQAVSSVSSVADRHPFEVLHEQLCDVCVAGAALGAAASFESPSTPVVSGRERAAPRRDASFIAAFSPLFRSQAPPALL